MTGHSNAPQVIIRRKKVMATGAHHGGAWKVAYADFVTAMMAFFLLMWLLNATTEKQRKGLSDYFNPTIAMNRVSAGGEGALSGDTIFTKESRANTGTGGIAVDRDGDATEADADAADKALAKLVDQALYGRGGESHTMQQLLRHVITRVTDEGVVIELYDLEDVRLFKDRTADPQLVTEALASVLARVLNMTTNQIAVNGHMHSIPIPIAHNPLWEVSAERAQVMRRLLERSGVMTARVQRVGGFADRKPVSANPAALRNNRIEIILLRRDR